MKMKDSNLKTAGLCLVTLLATPAHAEGGKPILGRETLDVPGYAITVEETEDFDEALIVNGQTVLVENLIFLIETHALEDGTALIGNAGLGSRDCAPSVFVLWMGTNGYRVDGPLESCETAIITRIGEGLGIRSQPAPGADTMEWIWTPDQGLSAPVLTPFAPEKTLLWHDFSELRDLHPLHMMNYREVYATLTREMPPEDFANFLLLLSEGIGTGVVSEEGWYGEVCDPFVCDERFARMWIDQDWRRILVLWHDAEGSKGIHPADTAEWPLWLLMDAADLLEKVQ